MNHRLTRSSVTLFSFRELADDVATGEPGQRFTRNGLADVDVARRIDGYRLGHGVVEFLPDRAGLGAGDEDPLTVVVVHHVKRVVSRDEHAARRAQVRPLAEIAAVLVEDLDALVGAVAYEQPSSLVDHQRMRHVEFSRAAALPAPGLDERAVLRELDD